MKLIQELMLLEGTFREIEIIVFAHDENLNISDLYDGDDTELAQKVKDNHPTFDKERAAQILKYLERRGTVSHGMWAPTGDGSGINSRNPIGQYILYTDALTSPMLTDIEDLMSHQNIKVSAFAEFTENRMSTKLKAGGPVKNLLESTGQKFTVDLLVYGDVLFMPDLYDGDDEELTKKLSGGKTHLDKATALDFLKVLQKFGRVSNATHQIKFGSMPEAQFYIECETSFPSKTTQEIRKATRDYFEKKNMGVEIYIDTMYSWPGRQSTRPGAVNLLEGKSSEYFVLSIGPNTTEDEDNVSLDDMFDGDETPELLRAKEAFRERFTLTEEHMRSMKEALVYLLKDKGEIVKVTYFPTDGDEGLPAIGFEIKIDKSSKPTRLSSDKFLGERGWHDMWFMQMEDTIYRVLSRHGLNTANFSIV